MPEWFYSSLAQCCASIAGFIGGFLFLRLLQLTTDWKGLLDRLRTRRRVWIRLQTRVDGMDSANRDSGPYEGEHALAHEQLTQAWGDLYDVLKEKRRARISWEIYLAAVLLLVLLAVGTFMPLLALGNPQNAAQMNWIVPTAAVVCALFFVLGRGTWAAQQELKKFELGDLVEGKLIDYEMQIEAWEYEDQERQRERKRQREREQEQ